MPLVIESTRSDLVESRHVVHVAVVDTDGKVIADSGDATRISYWRSSAKPFQSLPLVREGAADRYGFTSEMLALSCASHSSEPEHIAVVERMLAAIGCEEKDLACGPHPPLSPAIANAFIREGREPSPRFSNCSGKHAGMLALAKHHGWKLSGYEQREHPVQQRVLAEIMRYTELSASEVHLGVDGCTAVCFALPLFSMAKAYARFGASPDPAEKRLREAIWAHPLLIAGRGRLCTVLMEKAPGDILAKVGADGVYGAAIPALGLGIALKVEDGDWASTAIALMAVLRQLLARFDPSRLERLDLDSLGSFIEAPIRTTRGHTVGARRASGSLSFV